MNKKQLSHRLLSLALVLVLVMGMLPHLAIKSRAADLTKSFTLDGRTYECTLIDFHSPFDSLMNVTSVSIKGYSRSGNTIIPRIHIYTTKGTTEYSFPFLDPDCTKALDASPWNNIHSYAHAFGARIRVTRAAASHTGGTGCAAKCSRCSAVYTAVPHTPVYALQSGTTNVLVETCAYCSNHNATATLTATDATYTGYPQRTAQISYSDNWIGEKNKSIKYTDDTNAGTVQASVTVGGHTLTTDFRILPKDIMGPGGAYINPSSAVYTGKVHTPNFTVSNPFAGNTQFTVNWSPSEPVNVGRYTANVKVIGNYSGSFYLDYNVTAASLSNVDLQFTPSATGCGAPSVTGSASSVNNQPVHFTYSRTGSEPYGPMPVFHEPGSYTVYYKVTAPNHHDYKSSFTLTVNPHRNLSYTVEGGNVLVQRCSSCGLYATATLNTKNGSYNGSPIQGATVTYSESWAGSRPGEESIVYSNNLNAGTATASIQIHGYTLSQSFTIGHAYIYAGGNGTMEPAAAPYTGVAHSPQFTYIWQGITLTENVDYYTTWLPGAPVDAGKYEMVFCPMGNFMGSPTTYYYTVSPADLREITVVQTGTVDSVPTVYASAIAVNDQPVTFTYSTTENGTYGPMPILEDGTHTIYYKASAPNHNDAMGSFTVSVNHVCTGGTATCTKLANCSICGREYGYTDPYNHAGPHAPSCEWVVYEDGSCYVSAYLMCASCEQYSDYTSGDATLTEESPAVNCQAPGSRTWSFSFSFGEDEYTETYVETVYNDIHVALDDQGFCSTCGGFEAAVWNEEEGIYEIGNAGQLYWYAKKLNENNSDIYVKLMKDIIIPETAPNWSPISASYVHFDGNFKTISGLKCVGGEDETYVGLFGDEVWWYEISNLHIDRGYFEGQHYVAAIVAQLDNGGKVSNCCVTNTVVKGGSVMGTLVGYLGGSLLNSYADMPNLVGTPYGTMENCYYLSETETEDGGKTEAQFASGEVAYLLQHGLVGEEIYDEESGEIIGNKHIWGQAIGQELYPTLGGKKVYYGFTSCHADQTAPVFSNDAKAGETKPGHTYADGQCSVCAEACGHEEGWQEATCTAPKTCPICGKTEGMAMGHTDGDSDGYCDICMEQLPKAVLSSRSLSLNGEIAINFYMELSENILADEHASMKFIREDGTKDSVSLAEASKILRNGKDYYVFTVRMTSKEMSDEVRAQFFWSGGSSEVYTYSVKTYAQNVLPLCGEGLLKDLLTAMLHYGAAAQTYFDYHTERLANEGMAIPDYSEVKIEGFEASNGQATELLSYYGASLQLNSRTAIRFVFVADPSLQELSASCNGQTLEWTREGNMISVIVDDISAMDLDEFFTLTVQDGTGSIEVSYSPMTYCMNVLTGNKPGYTPELKTLAAAMYVYNQVANTYFDML